MKTLDHLGNPVRGFQVLVSKTKNTPIVKAKNTILYPICAGEKAIKLMGRLAARGFDSVAITESFGEKEYLDINEMKLMVL